MAKRLIPCLILVLAALPGLASADALTAIIQQDLATLGYDPGNLDGEATVPTVVAISKFQAENDMEVTGEVTPQLAGVIKAAISKQAQPAPAVQAAPPAAAQMQQAQAAQMAAAMQSAQMQGAAGMDPAAMQAGMDPAALQAMMAQMQGGAAMDPAMLQAIQAAQMQGAAGMDPAAMQATQAQTAQQACLQQKIAEAQEAQQSAQKRRGFGSLMRAVSRLGGDEIAGSIASATADIAEASATINDLESAARDLGLTEADVASCGAAQ